jgi:LAO/AO transport system kinase
VGLPLVERLLAGDLRALARAITLVESASSSRPAILKEAYPATGRAAVVGITGPPGAGKSSLVDALARAYRRRGERIGIIAVDPSSAFSGGAILGDRIRMQQHHGDPGVYIRSMANRGHAGGLARATPDAVDLIDAAGFSIILVETVGVGQDEVEVVDGAETVVVVLVPGMGDDIQSLKAGIMEIAHLFVINKCDRGGADRVETDIQQLLSLGSWEGRWRPRILRTTATTGEGVEGVVGAIAEHQEKTRGATGAGHRRRDLSRARFLGLLQERLLLEVRRRVGAARLEAAIDEIASRRIDPYTAAAAVAAEAGLGDGP